MSLAALYMYRLTIRIRSDDTIRPNMNTLFGALFGTEVNTKRIFGTSLVHSAKCRGVFLSHINCFMQGEVF